MPSCRGVSSYIHAGMAKNIDAMSFDCDHRLAYFRSYITESMSSEIIGLALILAAGSAIFCLVGALAS